MKKKSPIKRGLLMSCCCTTAGADSILITSALPVLYLLLNIHTCKPEGENTLSMRSFSYFNCKNTNDYSGFVLRGGKE